MHGILCSKVRKKKTSLAINTLVSDLASYTAMLIVAKYNFRASLFALLIPLLQMRIGMMVGNWGQHALVDELDPDSDFRSRITLIAVAVSRQELLLASDLLILQPV